MNDISTAAILERLTLLQKAALLSGGNTWQTRSIDSVGLPSIWLADGPHGIRKQIGSADHLGLHASEPATCFPTAATIANSWDPALAEQIGSALGREASAQGVHVLLGPGLNIKRSPLGGRNFEYFSEDPELSGLLAAAYVRGIQSEGVAATPKHFAVNSQELRRMVTDSVVDERTLRELYLTAFEIVVRESAPWAIMSSYNRVNGEYAHESTHLLDEVLRSEWGFDGAVISDWGGGNDPAAAVRAGGTLEMPSPGFDSARAIVAAVESGALAETEVDARVIEIIDLVRRVTRRTSPAPADLAGHHALARRAAAESAVLLRNEGDLLPLPAGARVALIGEFATAPRYQGAGSSNVNPTHLTTLIGSIGATPLELVGAAQGYRRDGIADPGLVAEAVALATSSDVAVLALGLPDMAESEGADRSSLTLPADQIALLTAVAEVNPRTVVVLSAGGAVEMPWLGHASALVHGYLGGQAGAAAILDVLTGAVDPSGRLAETLPVKLSDTPTAGRFPSRDRAAEYREGIFVGYRYYDSADIPVEFPFGFGLGYTTFAMSELGIDGDTVSVTVTNTGGRAGSEVVQLYVRRLDESRVSRPRHELKGFAKVQLQPGESRAVEIALGPRAFRYFDSEVGSWGVEGGDYEISVGANVRDLVLSQVVHRDGTATAGRTTTEPEVYRRAAILEVTDAHFAALLGRPLPEGRWGDGPVGLNDPVDRLAVARSRLARVLFGVIDRRRLKAELAGSPDLNILFIFNAPFRVVSKMSGGLATQQVTEALLTLVNGQTVRGLGRTLAAFVRGRRAERRSAQQFRDADKATTTSATRSA